VPYNGTDTTGGDSSMSNPSTHLLIPTWRACHNTLDMNAFAAKRTNIRLTLSQPPRT